MKIPERVKNARRELLASLREIGADEASLSTVDEEINIILSDILGEENALTF